MEENKYRYYGGEVGDKESLSKAEVVNLIRELEEKLELENNRLIKAKAKKEQLERGGITEENDEKGDWFMINDVTGRISLSVEKIQEELRSLKEQYVVKSREERKRAQTGFDEETA